MYSRKMAEQNHEGTSEKNYVFRQVLVFKMLSLDDLPLLKLIENNFSDVDSNVINTTLLHQGYLYEYSLIFALVHTVRRYSNEPVIHGFIA